MVGLGRYFTAPLIRRDDLGGDHYVLWFASDRPVAARAGQFTMVRSRHWGASPLLPRPMSLLTGGREPSILVKVVGEGTADMARAPMGEPWELLAPLGRAWTLPQPDETPILVAGGVGIAPIVFLASQLALAGHRPGGPRPPVIGLYGGRTARDLPLFDRLEQVADVEVSTEDGSRGTTGRVTLLLERLLAARAHPRPTIYTCGPHAMMAAVAALAERHGVPCQASLEAPMACGYGVCLGCPAARREGGYLYTCVEGPCVDASAIDWKQGVF